MNIKQIDYRIQGYKKKKTNNDLGDREIVEYYGSYDEQTETFTDIKVRETRSHTRNSDGIPTATNVSIEWFGSDKTTPRATKTLVKPLDGDDGMKVNEQARGRLLNKAKGTAIFMMGLAQGIGFMRGLGGEVGLYREGDRQPLIDSINNSTDPNATQAVKDTLVAILDKSYIPV